MKFSIRWKAIIMIFIFAFVLITLSTGMYARVIVNLTRNQYGERAEDLAKTAREFVDVEEIKKLRENVEAIYNATDNKVFSDRWGEDDWNEYVANFKDIETSEEFLSIRETLRKVQDNNDTDCIYLVFVDQVNEAFIYLVDGAYEDACPPGCIDYVYEVNKEVLTNPSRGFPAYETNTEEYGKLITAGVPIYYEGKVIAFSMVDISLKELHSEQANSIFKLYGYLVSTAVLLSIATLIVIQIVITRPIKKLSDASRRFAYTKTSNDEYVFANLKIRTRDELQELAESMKNMEIQIKDNIKELVDMNEKLIASQNMATEMSELANKDALTSVGNSMAYERFISKIDEQIKTNPQIKFGVAMFDLNLLKNINDTYGHKCGDEAIIKLSKIICKLFAHSPVFRIGGDEFTVILQNEDYENAKKIINNFRNFMKKNANDTSIPIEERISSPVGYSEFDATVDNSYLDVFKRADNEMYQEKNKMKK